MSLNPPKAHDYSRTLITVMKDEAPYIVDWLSYHFSIGFTHAVVLTNDCSDDTDKLLRKLGAEGLVTHKNNAAPHPRGPQKTGYNRMRKLDAVINADWLMSLDVDEYLRIDVGNGTIDALFDVIGSDISAVSFVWQLFGNNDITEISEQPIIEQFDKAAHPLQARPYECLGFKTLYKNGYFSKIGTHRPNDFDETRIKDFEWIDADGCSQKIFTKHRHWMSHFTGLGFGTTLGRINHYALRSTKSFANKWDRGFVHQNAPTVRGKGTAFDYWKLFNWNTTREIGIQKHIDRSNEIKAQLLNIKRVAHFHDSGLNFHMDKANTFAKSHPEFFKKIHELGHSHLNDDLPDFSKHGCPPIGTRHYVNTANLNKKLSQSLLPKKVTENTTYSVIVNHE